VKERRSEKVVLGLKLKVTTVPDVWEYQGSSVSSMPRTVSKLQKMWSTSYKNMEKRVKLKKTP
jgi:hypothetical protein